MIRIRVATAARQSRFPAASLVLSTLRGKAHHRWQSLIGAYRTV